MIFIGRELSNPNAHFVTNVVASLRSGNDLLIDTDFFSSWSQIEKAIHEHCAQVQEQYVLYNPAIDEDVSLRLKKRFPHLVLIMFFSDDEWRHENYNRYLALYADRSTIAVKENIERYRNYGLNNVHLVRWCLNPNLFYPVPAKQANFDVSFIGSAYGKRVSYIRYLLRAGVNVRVFGAGWSRYRDLRAIWGGLPSHEQMLQIVSQSKINLNFLWTSRGDDGVTIKGRVSELAACKAFQLANYSERFADYGIVPGQHLATFNSEQDLLSSIHHYLAHPDERIRIAEAGHHHALESLTWVSEFKDVLSETAPSTRHVNEGAPFTILVINPENFCHALEVDDPRLRITFSKNADHMKAFDGVIALDRDTTLNNDVLYMMAFAITADQSDCVLANFYSESTWIRFKDRDILRYPRYVYLLPASCKMVAGRSWLGNQCGSPLVFSFIEYPTFSINLAWPHGRLLRMLFGDHGDTRRKFREAFETKKYWKAISIVFDRYVQKILF